MTIGKKVVSNAFDNDNDDGRRSPTAVRDLWLFLADIAPVCHARSVSRRAGEGW
jgi:hypothetical protein